MSHVRLPSKKLLDELSMKSCALALTHRANEEYTVPLEMLLEEQKNYFLAIRRRDKFPWPIQRVTVIRQGDVVDLYKNESARCKGSECEELPWLLVDIVADMEADDTLLSHLPGHFTGYQWRCMTCKGDLGHVHIPRLFFQRSKNHRVIGVNCWPSLKVFQQGNMDDAIDFRF